MTRVSAAEARRPVLVETARRLFLTHGYEATTLGMVIAEAGGSRRTIYELFGNKEGLFIAAISENARRMLSTIDEGEAAGGTPAEVLSHFGWLFLTMLTRPAAVESYRQVLATAPRHPDLGAAFYRNGPERVHASIADYLCRQDAAGSLRLNVDPMAAAGIFLEMIKGPMQMRGLVFPGYAPAEDELDIHVERAVTIFLGGIGGQG